MKRFMVIAVVVGVLFGFIGQPFAADMKSQSSEAIGNIQRVNELMGRAMGMVTDGASLVLVANMKLAPQTDTFTAEQGMKMIQNGCVKTLVMMSTMGVM